VLFRVLRPSSLLVSGDKARVKAQLQPGRKPSGIGWHSRLSPGEPVRGANKSVAAASYLLFLSISRLTRYGQVPTVALAHQFRAQNQGMVMSRSRIIPFLISLAICGTPALFRVRRQTVNPVSPGLATLPAGKFRLRTGHATNRWARVYGQINERRWL